MLGRIIGARIETPWEIPGQGWRGRGIDLDGAGRMKCQSSLQISDSLDDLQG
jgi:hypothetical protein